jgi:uncharacterized protein YdaT
VTEEEQTRLEALELENRILRVAVEHIATCSVATDCPKEWARAALKEILETRLTPS